MIEFLDTLKRKIMPDKAEEENVENNGFHCDNYLISLGVLLWAVAEADDSFLPEEKRAIQKVLKSCSKIEDNDMSIVIRAIEEANLFKIDLHSFTREISDKLGYDARLNIVENLFRVACADKDLDNSELEMIRKISGLIKVEHKEFIDAKIKIKKEFGLDTAGL